MSKEKQKDSLRFFVRRHLGPEYEVEEAAKFIGHTKPGIWKMYKRDPVKLKALFLGYKALAELGEHAA